MKLYMGMPSQMPQQVLLPPQEIRPQPEMVVDVLGVRVPASMLESGYFWAFLMVAAVVVLGVAYLKFKARAQG
jgi:hypothetical protein